MPDREQLIDLKHDPGEMKNLAGPSMRRRMTHIEDYKDVLDTHRQLLRRWVESLRDSLRRTGDRIAAGYVNVKS